MTAYHPSWPMGQPSTDSATPSLLDQALVAEPQTLVVEGTSTPVELTPCPVHEMIESMKKGLQAEIDKSVKLLDERVNTPCDNYNDRAFATVPLGLVQEYAKMLGIQVNVGPLQFKEADLTDGLRHCPAFEAEIGLLKMLRGNLNPKEVLKHFRHPIIQLSANDSSVLQTLMQNLTQEPYVTTYALFGVQQFEKFQLPSWEIQSLDKVVDSCGDNLGALARGNLNVYGVPYLLIDIPSLISAKRLGARKEVLHSIVDKAYTQLLDLETRYYGRDIWAKEGEPVRVAMLTAKLQLAILHGSGLLYDDLKPAVPKVESQTAPFSGAGTNVNGPVSGTGYNGNGPVEL